MTILIVGGAGFIGSHLVDYYLNLNKEVIAVDNLSTGKLDNISHHLNNPKFKFYETDLLEWKELDSILENSELVYDVAAVVGMFYVLERPIATLNVNINLTERLLAGISKLRNKPPIIVASSSEVYGSRPEGMKETDALLIETTQKAHANYPISKLCNEVAALAYYKEKQVPAIVVRIFNTVGPRQAARYGMVIPRFINQALNNEPMTIFDDGQQTRSFSDVRDVCNIFHQLAMTDKSVGEIINVGNDKSISILKLAELVKELAQSTSGFIFQNYDEVYGKEYINIQNRKPDLTKLNSLISFTRQWTLEDTIKNMIDILNIQSQ
ncbi:MAG: NAD-dependent epimerase/dehydratase family protein [Tatlockia sp.]|nr:NAD-dependent epimerase/dehydratase family protein [Tatlockia sp.]